MFREDLVEKGLMPNDVDFCIIYENCFEYWNDGDDERTVKHFDGTILCFNYYSEANHKHTIKHPDGTILCENADGYWFCEYGFSYRVGEKWTVKLWDGAVLCEDVDAYILSSDFFILYKIYDKWTVKFLDGTLLFENAKYCEFTRCGLEYRIDGGYENNLIYSYNDLEAVAYEVREKLNLKIPWVS